MNILNKHTILCDCYQPPGRFDFNAVFFVTDAWGYGVQIIGFVFDLRYAVRGGGIRWCG